MYNFGLSKKQCGVIFANIKNGKLNLADDFAKWMYANVADQRVFMNAGAMCDVFDRMRKGLECIFSNDFEAANEELAGAYVVYHVNFKN